MIYHLTRPAQGGMLKVLERVLETYAQDGHSQELWIHPASREGGKLCQGTRSECKRLAFNRQAFSPRSGGFFSQRRLGDGLVFYHGFKSFLVANPRENPVILSLYNAVFPPWERKACVRQRCIKQRAESEICLKWLWLRLSAKGSKLRFR